MDAEFRRVKPLEPLTRFVNLLLIISACIRCYRRLISLPLLRYTPHKVFRSMRLYFHIFSQYIVHGALITFAKMFKIIHNIRVKAQG